MTDLIVVPLGRKRRRAPGEAAGTRNANDAYDTDPPLALACVEWVAGSSGWNSGVLGLRVLDPTAGGGPFVAAARRTFPEAKVIATDIRPECRDACLASGASGFEAMDALTMPPEWISKVDLIITNPPFVLADQLVRHFWPHMKEGATLAFLLSVTFWGSTDRWEIKEGKNPGLFTFAMPASCPMIVPRPAFTGTSPKFEAALFVWRKGASAGGAMVPPNPIRWVPSKRTRRKAVEVVT